MSEYQYFEFATIDRPLDWMRRYFDAFVYLAGWAHCRFAMRLPRDIFGKAELTPFGVKQSLTIDASMDHWILDWSLEDSENYDRFAEDDGRLCGRGYG